MRNGIGRNTCEIVGEEPVYRSRIVKCQDGMIINSGEPYTFEGWAFKIEGGVSAVEFSLDRGATWATYSTEDADSQKWVYWNYTYTFPTSGTYTLYMRFLDENGDPTPHIEKKIINVRTPGEDYADVISALFPEYKAGNDIWQSWRSNNPHGVADEIGWRFGPFDSDYFVTNSEDTAAEGDGVAADMIDADMEAAQTELAEDAIEEVTGDAAIAEDNEAAANADTETADEGETSD